MPSLTVADQMAALQNVVFGAIEQWNASHPHPLPSHKERAAIYVTQVYTGRSEIASYVISVECTLAGSGPLKFHGTDLATVAEHARLTLEHKIDVELARRTERAFDAGQLHDIAV